jgi:excisionase family DNA binding protein
MLDATTSPQSEAVLLDVQAVSRLLGVSPRTVRRLSDGGRMPRPFRLGGCVRWSKSAIDEWLSTGCRPVRTPLTRKDVR